MLYRIGTVAELEAIRGKLHHKVYDVAIMAVSMLDREYGADRDVDRDDGGFLLIGETVADEVSIQGAYMDLNSCVPEEVNCFLADKPWLNVLYLQSNEFGVNVLLPLEIAPDMLVRERRDDENG